MRTTHLDKRRKQYYIETKGSDFTHNGTRVYGTAAAKLAMYENIADTPAEFATTIRTAQEMLDGIAYTPKQVERIQAEIEAQADKVAAAVLEGIKDLLEQEGHAEAVKCLIKNLENKEEVAQ